MNKSNINSQDTKTILICSPYHQKKKKTNTNKRRYRTQGLTHLLDGQGRYVWIIDNP